MLNTSKCRMQHSAALRPSRCSVVFVLVCCWMLPSGVQQVRGMLMVLSSMPAAVSRRAGRPPPSAASFTSRIAKQTSLLTSTTVNHSLSSSNLSRRTILSASTTRRLSTSTVLFSTASSSSSSPSPSAATQKKKAFSSKQQQGNNNNRKKKSPPNNKNSFANLPLPTVQLKRNHQSRAFRNGSQLVFGRAVMKEQNCDTADLQLGDLVHVVLQGEVNKRGEPLPPAAIGWGVYNPHSLYRIRLLNHRFLQPQLYRQLVNMSTSMEKKKKNDDGETSETVHGTDDDDDDSSMTMIRLIVEHHLQQALRLRRTGLGLPDRDTDTYRLVNGEGDGLSGLAVDVIGHSVDNNSNNNSTAVVAVVMSSAGWVERYRSIIETELARLLPDADVQIVWKTAPARLQQDGYETTNTATATVDDNDSDDDDDDNVPTVLSMENGLVFETYPSATVGQKTGVYCDQRENRARLAAHCANKRVLDLCCYTGGFALAAAKAGAVHCTGVDSSGAAIATARANAARNGLSDRTDFVASDVTQFLQACQQEYDAVVLDPPKLAPSAKHLDKARRKYHALNRNAVRVISGSRGGLLLTCTCSAAMTQAEGGQYFLKTVQAAALAAGRRVTLLSRQGAAPCHALSPVAFPASDYLTAALFFVHPTTSAATTTTTSTSTTSTMEEWSA